MNKVLILIFATLSFSSAFAAFPQGVWLNEHIVADDGGYGAYYKGWYFVSDKTVDAIITLGAHYDKQKLQILSDDGKTVKFLDVKARTVFSYSYAVENDVLKICNDVSGCTPYSRTNKTMEPDIPPATPPDIVLHARWCVDNDCETTIYSREQSLFICNINSELAPYFTRYQAPANLVARYKLNMSIQMYAYRLDSKNELSSYSSSMYLQANTPFPTTIGQSGVKRLQAGPFATMSGTAQGHTISVEFSVAR